MSRLSIFLCIDYIQILQDGRFEQKILHVVEEKSSLQFGIGEELTVFAGCYLNTKKGNVRIKQVDCEWISTAMILAGDLVCKIRRVLRQVCLARL